MLRVVVAITIAAGSAALGQVLLRRGMQHVGSLEGYGAGTLLRFFWHAASNPYVIGGTLLNALFYFLFVTALSWTDVTVALPLTAIEYGFAALLAIVILNEVVPPLRWAGTGLVIAGVVLISVAGRSPA